jgi:sugar phosphate isomerase/epimerase
MISRRSLFMVPAVAAAESTVHGVRLGVSGYSFQGFSLDESIAAMNSLGLSRVEAWFRHIEPKLTREQLRDWRLSVSLEIFRDAARKYAQAGIDVVAYTFDMKDDFTTPELDRGFQMAKALGVHRIASSTTLSVAARLPPLMAKYRMEVAFHGHSDASNPNQLAGPDSFRKVLAMSPLAKINLDIGQFVAAGFDPLPFIREQHERIAILHLRDGAKGRGTKLPWGTGATPIREVLQLLKMKRYSISADIEYDYAGPEHAVEEIARCRQFCKDALV